MCIIVVTKKKGGNNYDFWKQRTRANVYECFVVTAVLSARTFKRNRPTWIYADSSGVQLELLKQNRPFKRRNWLTSKLFLTAKQKRLAKASLFCLCLCPQDTTSFCNFSCKLHFGFYRSSFRLRTKNEVATSRKQCYASHKQCCLRQTMLHFV